MHPAARELEQNRAAVQRAALDLSAIELQGLITLAVRNGVLHASAVLAVIGFVVGMILELLR